MQVNTSDLFGGCQKVAYDLFRSYHACGHCSWLAVGSKISDDPDVFAIPNNNYRRRWARTCLAIEDVLSPLARSSPKLGAMMRSCLHGLGQPRQLLEIERGREDFEYPGAWHLLELPPERPDVLHCHNLHGGYFDLRALPWLCQQVPVVVTLHDAWLLSGHCAHSFDCERWRRGCRECPDLTIYPAIKRDATAYNWHRKRDIYARSRLHIVAPSYWLIEKAKQSILTQAIETTRVIPNGVDLGVFRPGDQKEARKLLSLPENATIVLLIAHNLFKDYDTMEAALSRLDEKNGEELIFVCLGKTGADKSVGQGHMIYRGFERKEERMVLYYQACEIYIHAAKDEAFGLTITEALACGVPTVATAVGGIKEQLEDGVNGFLVPPKDFEAMASRVRQLLIDKELYRRVATKAAESARRRFELNQQVEDYLNWYQEILDSHYAERRDRV